MKWLKKSDLICKKENPLCEVCPIQSHCKAYKQAKVENYPIRKNKKKMVKVVAGAFILSKNGSYLIQKRPVGEIMGGLWEFPGGKREPGESMPATVRREVAEELGVRIRVGRRIAVVEHAYTHFRVTLYAYRCRLDGDPPPVRTMRAARASTGKPAERVGAE